MSYEPTLIIKFNDLKKIEKELEEEQWSENSDISRIAKFLLEELKYEDLLPKFEGTTIIMSRPEFTTFNSLVRERLNESSVYYVTFF
jgi:hypothetical protein